MTDGREMYQEINALLGNLATALALPPETVAELLEQGALTLEMGKDAAGNHFVLATHGDGDDQRVARVYKDSIHHLGAPPPDGTTGASGIGR
ncbi:hypothetical protein [Roseospira goensis]|uniref:Uncharacterized protein n=1 Tax=Roseospira goensis TaxID=391922 RepID=A0A7W6S029_9PROT|nr:hypothetical protein [Roseospira goensis]MBB4286388.1 hypothetical protein [Roseospira goensis]